MAANDLVIWATACSGVVPNVDPTDGTNAATSFAVSAAGEYKLCYRADGASDSVEQAGITLTVQVSHLSFDQTVGFTCNRLFIEMPLIKS